MEGFPHLVWVLPEFWLNSLLMTRLLFIFKLSFICRVSTCLCPPHQGPEVGLGKPTSCGGLESLVSTCSGRRELMTTVHLLGGQTILDAFCCDLTSERQWLVKVALVLLHSRIWGVEWLAPEDPAGDWQSWAWEADLLTSEPGIVSYLTCVSLPRPCSFQMIPQSCQIYEQKWMDCNMFPLQEKQFQVSSVSSLPWDNMTPTVDDIYRTPTLCRALGLALYMQELIPSYHYPCFVHG